MHQIKNMLIRRGPLGFIMMIIFRFGDLIYYKVKLPVVRQILWIVYKVLDLIIVRILGNAEIPAGTKIGSNLGLPHSGKGVIISPDAVIGNNVTIYHQVTIGVINGSPFSPQIGDNVFIGTGAKILGPVKIGENAMIGANAVVIKDVPPNCTAVGVPAKIVNKKQSIS
ncbi:serine O-acetyltransferase [Neobacillus sp. NPDC058068]|uniref:serine O-acetyltransferase n=1 Tax=Neobacillus sp. NPDC058068 TaxID=3346325 RepID=UPI0036D9F43B